MIKNKMMFLSVMTTLVSLGAHANQLDRDGILRSDSGRVLYMYQDEAMKSCPAGTHVPTARELAQISLSSGLSEIYEAGQVDENSLPRDYWEVVEAVNPDGNVDKFYLHFEKYQKLNGDLGRNLFWSSSGRNYAPGVGFFLNGYSGDLDSYGYQKMAVVCFGSR